jgi:hypothetical protein
MNESGPAAGCAAGSDLFEVKTSWLRRYRRIDSRHSHEIKLPLFRWQSQLAT